MTQDVYVKRTGQEIFIMIEEDTTQNAVFLSLLFKCEGFLFTFT